MKKKLIGLFLIFSLTILMISGCGGKDAASEDTDDAHVSSEKEESEEKYKAEYGEFYILPEDGMLTIPDLGLQIELPKELKGKEDRIAAAGYLDERYAYAVIHMINENDEYDIELGIVTVIGDIYPVDTADYINDDAGVTSDIISDLGSNGSLNYIAFDMGRMYKDSPGVFDLSAYTDEQKSEYLELLKYSDELIENITLKEIILPKSGETDADADELMGITVLDLDQNSVSMNDIISANKVTMINFWGTYCGPCIREMPSLTKLADKYRDQGFEIVGMTCDILQSDGTYSKALIQDARDIIDDTGVTYPVMIATLDMLKYAQLTVFPTTIFVDENGKLLADPIYGSNSEAQWEKLIKEALEMTED